MNPDEMVRWMMERLMKSTAENFELALARFDTGEREQALIQARRLMESVDDGEQELGQRLRAEILRVQELPQERLLELRQAEGGSLVPLSLPSSGALPSGVTSSNALGNTSHKPGEGSQSMSGSTSTSTTTPSKRPRGRPRKTPRP